MSDPDFPTPIFRQTQLTSMINMVIPIPEGLTMITQTSAVSFRQNLGEMLNQVQYRRDSVVINKDGKPVAALVDARLFERIRRMQARFESLCERLESGFAAIDEAEGMAEIDKAVKQDRAQQKKKSKSR